MPAMRLLRSMTLLLLLLPGALLAQERVYLWQDDRGGRHLAGSLEEIPEPFRETAIPGIFTPQGAAPSPRPDALAWIAPQEAPSPLSPLGPSRLSFFDETAIEEQGTLHLEGRIRNTLPYPIAELRVQIRLLDGSGEQVAELETFADPPELAPGAEGVYHIAVAHDATIEGYEREATWRSPPSPGNASKDPPERSVAGAPLSSKETRDTMPFSPRKQP
ncbi:MAG: hypothetical protein D6795_06685 [Deltaproteobacteria bacterium]|nr:MAG: hypothetical protein D6795_06685 [Deltaproteobacteria bacterium]